MTGRAVTAFRERTITNPRHRLRRGRLHPRGRRPWAVPGRFAQSPL